MRTREVGPRDNHERDSCMWTSIPFADFEASSFRHHRLRMTASLMSRDPVNAAHGEFCFEGGMGEILSLIVGVQNSGAERPLFRVLPPVPLLPTPPRRQRAIMQPRLRPTFQPHPFPGQETFLPRFRRKLTSVLESEVVSYPAANVLHRTDLTTPPSPLAPFGKDPLKPSPVS
jgi:hypothetical protein